MRKVKKSIWLIIVLIRVTNFDAVMPSIATELATSIEDVSNYNQSKVGKENEIISPDNVQDCSEENLDLQIFSGSIITQETLNSIYNRNGKKEVYLTFDDGPTPYVTPKILDILKKEEIKATFFPIEDNVKKFSGITKRIYGQLPLLNQRL